MKRVQTESRHNAKKHDKLGNKSAGFCLVRYLLVQKLIQDYITAQGVLHHTCKEFTSFARNRINLAFYADCNNLKYIRTLDTRPNRVYRIIQAGNMALYNQMCPNDWPADGQVCHLVNIVNHHGHDWKYPTLQEKSSRDLLSLALINKHAEFVKLFASDSTAPFLSRSFIFEHVTEDTWRALSEKTYTGGLPILLDNIFLPNAGFNEKFRKVERIYNQPVSRETLGEYDIPALTVATRCLSIGRSDLAIHYASLVLDAGNIYVSNTLCEHAIKNRDTDFLLWLSRRKVSFSFSNAVRLLTLYPDVKVLETLEKIFPDESLCWHDFIFELTFDLKNVPFLYRISKTCKRGSCVSQHKTSFFLRSRIISDTDGNTALIKWYETTCKKPFEVPEADEHLFEVSLRTCCTDFFRCIGMHKAPKDIDELTLYMRRAITFGRIDVVRLFLEVWKIPTQFFVGFTKMSGLPFVSEIHRFKLGNFPASLGFVMKGIRESGMKFEQSEFFWKQILTSELVTEFLDAVLPYVCPTGTFHITVCREIFALSSHPEKYIPK